MPHPDTTVTTVCASLLLVVTFSHKLVNVHICLFANVKLLGQSESYVNINLLIVCIGKIPFAQQKGMS